MKFKTRFSFSGFLILLIMGITLCAPLISPYDPNKVGVGLPFAGPSSSNLMGTDDLGRDLLSRLLYGGRITIFIAIAATIVALVI